MIYTECHKDQRVACDPLYSNLGIATKYGTVVRVRGVRDVHVLWDGASSPSSIDPRIIRPLKEGES